MTWKKIYFEKHEGCIDYATGQVEFYKLIFQNIIYASKFLSGLEPGNYQGWVCEGDGSYGLIDLDSV
jgi:hypothetical protein